MQEQSLFIEALDKEDPAERAAFLDQVGAADPALRQRIEKLLQRHLQANSFLEPPAPILDATAGEPSVSERPGTVIGPYKLMEQIGEGGMGLVFVAEQQQPVRRKVALKLIKPGMDTRDVIARFEAERQALALMDHPNIARVLDAGATDSGRPYFVMELVKGIPVTDYCDQNQLTLRQRLELFVSVCQAVQHAHQKGIIHRDLKPSNVLVTLHDGTPVVKVIDFGVAKAVGQQLTEKTIYTRFAQMIGTPLYMSPEQAEMSGLDVDTRSDVYSLAVLLYELLTGTTPFDGERLRQAAFDEIRRIIREEEPPKPSTRLSTLGATLSAVSARRKMDSGKLSALVRGDLDWIVMKGLEKDRARRYETASAFAADVRRHLGEEPVEARPPSTWYRFRKMARRNRATVTAAALVAAALLAGTVVALLFALEASRNAGWAYTEKANADRQTGLALASEATAKKQKEEIQRINDHLLASQNDLQHALNASDMKLIQFAWQSDDVGRVLDLLQTKIPGPGQKDLRDFEWHYWNRLVHGVKKVVELKGGEPKLFAEFSPDHGLLASVVVDQKQVVVRLWNTKTGAVVRDLKGPILEPLPKGKSRPANPAIGHVVFSPDGKWLAATVSIMTVSDTVGGGFGSGNKGTGPPTPGAGGGPADGKLPPGGKAKAPAAGPAGTGPSFGKGGKGGKGSKGFGGAISSELELWVWETKDGTALWHKSLPLVSRLELTSPFVRFHPTGKSVAVTVEDSKTKERAIQVLDGKDGTLLQKFSLPDELKKDGRLRVPLGLSRDWKRLLMEQYPTTRKPGEEVPNTLLLWDVTKKKEVWRVAGPKTGSVTARVAEFSPDGRRLAVQWFSAGPQRKSELWVYDAATGTALCLCKQDFLIATSGYMGLLEGGFVWQIQFSPDGTALLVKSLTMSRPRGPVRVWDAATGKVRYKVPILTDQVWDVSFGGGGEWLHIAAGKTVQVWPAGKPAPFRVSADPGLMLNAWSLSGDGRRLAVRVWPRATMLRKLPREIGIRVLDTASGKELFAVNDLPAPVTKLQLNEDGTRLAAHLGGIATYLVDSAGSKVVVWNVDTGKKLGSCDLPTAQAAKDKWTGAVFHQLEAFSADCCLAAFSYLKADGQRVLEVWKVPSGEQVAERTVPDWALGGVQFSPDGRLLIYRTKALGADSFPLPGTIEKPLDDTPKPLVHLLDRKVVKNLPPIPTPHMYGSFILSPDGKLLALQEQMSRPPGGSRARTNEIVVLDLAGKATYRPLGHTLPVIGIAFSPDGKRLASLAGKTGLGWGTSPVEIKLWDTHNGQEVLKLTVEPALRGGALQFSADGHQLFLLGRPKESPDISPMAEYELHTWDATPLPEPLK